ncbi:MAG: geranylgeranylglyceryl/heptaprenylglyceryl phosphate synthase [Melioribacteraceae bacterium]|nr:geranylgeranylglyceryl/heptaprenylglyceryl phosphate synthase [Melioribacteraceae bacterium]
MKIYNQLQDNIARKGAAYLILIDPDKLSTNKIEQFVQHCEASGVDGFLVGGSLMIDGDLKDTIAKIKNSCSLPVITFPGSVEQITPNADALLYISLISGRNADQIIGRHVLAAPYIKKIGIEPISTGYLLIESGGTTTAEYISNSKPIPRNKPEIAASTALAAQYLGMKFIYLEAGSGAELSVPNDMVKMVSSYCSVPVIVGGGIKDANTAREKVQSGAKIIVTGNYFEDENNWSKIKEFADAVHIKKPREV